MPVCPDMVSLMRPKVLQGDDAGMVLCVIHYVNVAVFIAEGRLARTFPSLPEQDPE